MYLVSYTHPSWYILKALSIREVILKEQFQVFYVNPLLQFNAASHHIQLFHSNQSYKVFLDAIASLDWGCKRKFQCPKPL